MQEDTNKAIIINTIITYIRLGVSVITGLLIARFALKALGVDDYGLFSVVGSIISFIAIINTIMLSTSNRFISIAIGKGEVSEINKQFNVSLVVHIAIALFVLLISFPLGSWYITNYVNYAGSIETVILVFDITIIGSVISFIGVPYNGLLVAKERFSVFSITDIIAHLIRLFIAYLLLSHFTNKLLVYTITLSFLAGIPTLVYYVYCKKIFPELVRFKIIRDKDSYAKVFNFSVWVGFGAVASVGKAQGAALIINMFFTTAMNAALGLANTVNSLIRNIASNASVSIAPQITKSYARGEKDRSEKLVCLSSKVTFMLMALIVSPFFVAPDYIFTLWLGEIPEYLVTFTQLLIIDALIGSLNAGIPTLVFAVGRIKWYQIIESSLYIISVVAAFFVLRAGAPAHYLLIVYIIFSVIVLVVRQILLNVLVEFDNKRLFKYSYLPSFYVILCFLPCFFIRSLIHPLVVIALSIVYMTIIIALVGLTKGERAYLLERVKRIVSRNQ